MRPRSTSGPLAAAALVVLSACLPPPDEPYLTPVRRPDPARAHSGQGSGTIVEGKVLRQRGGDLLNALSGRTSNMRVVRRSGTCPLITLRGDRTISGDTNPIVFVDGTEMTDTCILLQINTSDVASVELYPGGFTPRPGYPASATGLILVFLMGPGDEA